MSIRAMNWAMDARTDGVSAQCVLYVVADTANEHGISIHADPDYIAGRTRQSRATVFRRLKELEAAGALTRLKRFRADGAPVYEIRLHLDRPVDYDTAPECHNPQDVEGESQIETQAESQIETGEVSPVRLGESHSCDSKSPSKNPKDSPQAPLRGDSPSPLAMGSEAPSEPVVEGWDEFKRAWEADGIPISRVSITKPLIAALTPDERINVTKAAKGYLTHRSREKKPGTKLSAQNFIREIEAWDAWAKFAPPDTPPKAFVREGSREHKAIIVLSMIDGQPARTQCRFDTAQGASGLWRYGAVPDDLSGLAAFIEKPIKEWCLIEPDSQPFHAWAERIQRWTGNRPEPQIIMLDELKTYIVNGRTFEAHRRTTGLRVPCLWPPRKDGSISPTPDTG